MNTTSEAVKQLQETLKINRQALSVIDNLIAEHDYQDVASLVTQASIALLETSIALMQSQDESAIEKLESAEDLLDAVWAIIEGEVDED